MASFDHIKRPYWHRLGGLRLIASVSASSVRQNRDALQDLTGSTDPLRPAVAQKLYYIRNKI